MNMLPKIALMLRIACYLNNLFGKRLASDEKLFDEVLDRMRTMRHVPNELCEEVRAKNWNTVRRVWTDVNSESIVDFPELTEDHLKILFTGTYQLSQSISYLAELLNEDGTLQLKYHRDDSHILKLQVQSRHMGSKKYRCYVDYLPYSISHAGILRYYCECKNGARTVVCCAHVAAVIYFLSHARYLSKIVRPAAHLTTLFSHGAAMPVIEEDSDDD